MTERKKIKKCYEIATYIIIGLVCFGIGYGLGYGSAVQDGIEVAEKILDIKLKDWVEPYVSAKLGNTEWLNYGNSSLALD